MTAIMTMDQGEEISFQELRRQIEPINLRDGLRFVTQMTARQFVYATDESLRLVNSQNLAILAKAFVLWANPAGRLLNRNSAGQDEEGYWLLAGVNSLPWHSRLAAEVDTDTSVLSMIIRQAFLRVAADDPLDGLIARTWMMFHEVIAEGGFGVADPSAELETEFGVSAEDLWTLCLAIFSFYTTITTAPPYPWMFNPRTFVAEGPRRDEINGVLAKVVNKISLTPNEFREKYAAPDSKYRDQIGRDGYWISEFNILRDYPIVRLGPDEYCAPFPIFVFTRGAVGFYFDLDEIFAQRKLAANPNTSNPYNHAMRSTLGDVFQRYVGCQLRLIERDPSALREEFFFGPNGQMRTTDWILRRSALPVFFECKARRPTLEIQRYARPEDWEDELRKGLVSAAGQFARFLDRVDQGVEGLETFAGLQRCILVIMTYEPFPFHMIPDIRRLMERLTVEEQPLWTRLRDRITVVPMWIRELETAVAAELQFGIPIETQLQEYAAYRESSRRVERWENNMPVFPRHLEEFLQERYNNSRRIENPLCQSVWDSFCAHAQRRIFDEDIEIAEREIREIATRTLAFSLWEQRGRPLWDADTDWLEAKRILGFSN